MSQQNWKWCAKCASLFFASDAVCHAAANNGVHDLSASAMYAVSAQPRAPGQSGWRWCSRCQVLSFTGAGAIGPCQAGGPHDVSASGDYRLPSPGEGGGGQMPWRWCRKCQGLGWSAAGPCAAGGTHDFAGSGEYSVCMNGDPRAQAAVGQDGWRWCRQCELLCFDGRTACAAGGAHVSAGSGNYAVGVAEGPLPAANTQAGWAWCRKCYGLAFSKSASDGVCPRRATHDFSGSGNYAVLVNVPPGQGQQGKWAWCKLCQQMWYTGNGAGRCASSAAGGHSADGSGAYVSFDRVLAAATVTSTLRCFSQSDGGGLLRNIWLPASGDSRNETCDCAMILPVRRAAADRSSEVSILRLCGVSGIRDLQPGAFGVASIQDLTRSHHRELAGCCWLSVMQKYTISPACCFPLLGAWARLAR